MDCASNYLDLHAVSPSVISSTTHCGATQRIRPSPRALSRLHGIFHNNIARGSQFAPNYIKLCLQGHSTKPSMQPAVSRLTGMHVNARVWHCLHDRVQLAYTVLTSDH